MGPNITFLVGPTLRHSGGTHHESLGGTRHDLCDGATIAPPVGLAVTLVGPVMTPLVGQGEKYEP
jgi:hypothetical protein